jgi:hypothetical protein
VQLLAGWLVLTVRSLLLLLLLSLLLFLFVNHNTAGAS